VELIRGNAVELLRGHRLAAALERLVAAPTPSVDLDFDPGKDARGPCDGGVKGHEFAHGEGAGPREPVF
jgi:hypothetical protein